MMRQARFALVLMSLLAGCARPDPHVRDDAGKSALPAPANERGRLGLAGADASNARGPDMVGPGDEPVRVATDMAMANIRDFGAVPDDGLDDRAAIQSAVDSLPQGGTVYFPRGSYVLERAVIANTSRLTLLGEAGALVVVRPTGSALDNNEAFLVNPAQDVERVAVIGLSIQVNFGVVSGASQGVIQLNRCKDCLVQDVHMFWDPSWNPAVQKPAQVDGIVFALRSSGLIRGVVIDGMPKAGIYVASGATLADGAADVKIEACEVKNTNGPIAAEGIGISGSSRVIIDGCQVHHNKGHGIVIAANGLELPAGQPATHVQVIGGQYFDNGTGITIASAFDLVPRDIQIIGATVSNNVNNGITVYAGENIRMEGVTASHNGFGGIVLQDDSAATARIRRIDIIDPNVYNNSISPSNTVGGIILGGDVDRVTIEGGRVYDDAALPTQLHAFQIQSDGALRATNLRIVDVDAGGSGGIVQNTYATVTTPPLSGHYRIQHGGNPRVDPGLAAPVGSHFTDTATGAVYVKTGPEAQDWDEVALEP
jgi:hypothetical protein